MKLYKVYNFGGTAIRSFRKPVKIIWNDFEAQWRGWIGARKKQGDLEGEEAEALVKAGLPSDLIQIFHEYPNALKFFYWLVDVLKSYGYIDVKAYYIAGMLIIRLKTIIYWGSLIWELIGPGVKWLANSFGAGAIILVAVWGVCYIINPESRGGFTVKRPKKTLYLMEYGKRLWFADMFGGMGPKGTYYHKCRELETTITYHLRDGYYEEGIRIDYLALDERWIDIEQTVVYYTMLQYTWMTAKFIGMCYGLSETLYRLKWYDVDPYNPKPSETWWRPVEDICQWEYTGVTTTYR